jgi:hypothetical protein
MYGSLRAVPRPMGRYAIVTSVRCGMRWTQRSRKTGAPMRTAKPCGPGAQTLASSSRETFRESDGGYQARYPEESTEQPLTPLRREGRAPVHLWSYPRAFCCTGPTGAIGTRPSLRPPLRAAFARLGQIMPREGKVVSSAIAVLAKARTHYHRPSLLSQPLLVEFHREIPRYGSWVSPGRQRR